MVPPAELYLQVLDGSTFSSLPPSPAGWENASQCDEKTEAASLTRYSLNKHLLKTYHVGTYCGSGECYSEKTQWTSWHHISHGLHGKLSNDSLIDAMDKLASYIAWSTWETIKYVTSVIGLGCLAHRMGTCLLFGMLGYDSWSDDV